MKKCGVNELREMFLSFFESKGHLRLPSFSLIPQNDPSLLLINAGMSPMKTWFTGEEEPPRHRVCTCQKCIRTGDIENIGKTARHGTYFEMLGNFSFGDYFKHDAIHWAWEFFTSPEWMDIDPSKLYPSIYQDDDEAFDIWHNEIGIPEDRIFRFGKGDNFWEHGAGPCGPCSEIYYDRGPEYSCGKPDCNVGCDCDRYIEVWNLVFTQFNNDGNDNYTPLAQKNIDTGMGLERLAVVSQGVDSLFDVDTVMNITNKVSELTGARYGQSHKTDVSLRVITDHIRSATFMIGDGVLPSNEGRGYVLRRLLRRAARHGKLLGVNEPFLWKVCDMVIHENQIAYPDLPSHQDYITKVIRLEEENFGRTIDGGISKVGELIDKCKAEGSAVLPGAEAFRLYDTFGFPLDLTRDMLEEQGMEVDEEGFNRCMEEQRERARAARGDMSEAWQGLDLGLDNTPTKFTGYTDLTEDGKILAMVTDGELCSTISEGAEGFIVLDKTPFYAEMGGQCGDHGMIVKGDSIFDVNDVKKDKAGKFLHYGVMRQGELRVDDTVDSFVDKDRRAAIMRAHSATHLLQAALREVLGDHVHQAGSLVEPDRLRFDFSHFSAMTNEEIEQVSALVRGYIFAGMDVDVREMPIAEARKMGAIALFGEKYGDVVRVVKMGDCSTEFCGGTHLDNTAKVGPFRIVSESSISSGVRRIEAVTGKVVMEQMDEMNRTIARAADILKTTPADLIHKAETSIREIKDLRQEMDKLQSKLRSGELSNFMLSAKTLGPLKVITGIRQDLTVDELRKMGDDMRDREPAIVAVMASIREDKISLLAVCGKEAVKAGVKAGELIKKVAPVCGGSGGGKPDSAMGGGKDVSKLDDALATVDDFVIEKLGL